MRTLQLPGMLLLLLYMTGFAACKSWDDGAEEPDRAYSLFFESDSLEIRQGVATRLQPMSSNGTNVLEVSTGDTSLLKANVRIIENGTSHASGWIDLTGKRKGHTSLTVYDRIAEETVVLDVRITDFYLGMTLKGSNHPLFPVQRPGFLFLVDNDKKDFYFFGIKDRQPDGIILQGSYNFSVVENIPYLALTVAGGESYRFNLSQNDQNIYTILRHFFHLGAEIAPTAGTKDLDRSMQLYLKEEATGKEVFFTVTDPVMPAGILE